MIIYKLLFPVELNNNMKEPEQRAKEQKNESAKKPYKN